MRLALVKLVARLAISVLQFANSTVLAHLGQNFFSLR